MNNLPPDGALSGEQPGDEPEGIEPLDPERIAQLRQQMAQQFGQTQGWRPACVPCVNGHKLAIIELTQKLTSLGHAPGTPEFVGAMQQAAQFGQMMAQNPMAAQGMNGTKPDIIPAVRPADMIVGGTSVCVICFTPQKQTSLLAAPAGSGPGLWRPGQG